MALSWTLQNASCDSPPRLNRAIVRSQYALPSRPVFIRFFMPPASLPAGIQASGRRLNGYADIDPTGAAAGDGVDPKLPPAREDTHRTIS
jgi:hypothetical protein